MRKSIKHIDTKMEEFANKHLQVRGYKSEPVLDFDGLSYPLVWNFYGEIRPRNGEIEIEVTTLILDRVLEDTSNSLDVQNDTALIVCDFTTYFSEEEVEDEEIGFEMDDNAIATPVVMDYDDTVSGYSISSTIRMPHDMNKLGIPLE